MVTIDSRYDLCFLWFALELPVGSGHLDAAFGSFCAPTGEEEVVDSRVTELGKLFC